MCTGGNEPDPPKQEPPAPPAAPMVQEAYADEFDADKEGSAKKVKKKGRRSLRIPRKRNSDVNVAGTTGQSVYVPN